MLLYQDEARFSLVPTLCRSLGLKGHRLEVGTFDNKNAMYLFGALHAVDGRLSTQMIPWLTKNGGRPQGTSKNRQMQRAFVRFLRHLAKSYPASAHRRVVVVIDNAPWHRGDAVREVLAQHPHLELYRLPPYSPQLNKIERLWKVLRRRATHNRLFDTLQVLRSSLEASLKYLRAVRRPLLSLLGFRIERNRSEVLAV